MGDTRETADAIIGVFNANYREAMITLVEVQETGVALHENEACERRINALRRGWEAALTARITDIRAGKATEKTRS